MLLSFNVFGQKKPLTFEQQFKKHCFPTQKERETLIEGMNGKFYSLYELGFDKYAMMYESNDGNGNTELLRFEYIDSYTHKCLDKLDSQ